MESYKQDHKKRKERIKAEVVGGTVVLKRDHEPSSSVAPAPAPARAPAGGGGSAGDEAPAKGLPAPMAVRPHHRLAPLSSSKSPGNISMGTAGPGTATGSSRSGELKHGAEGNANASAVEEKRALANSSSSSGGGGGGGGGASSTEGKVPDRTIGRKQDDQVEEKEEKKKSSAYLSEGLAADPGGLLLGPSSKETDILVTPTSAQLDGSQAGGPVFTPVPSWTGSAAGAGGAGGPVPPLSVGDYSVAGGVGGVGVGGVGGGILRGERAARLLALEAKEHADERRRKKSSQRQMMVICLASIFLYLCVGVGFYCLMEGNTFIDSLYFSVATLTTVGYGDVSAHTQGSRLFTCLFVFVGVGIVSVCVTMLAAAMAQREADLMEALLMSTWRREHHGGGAGGAGTGGGGGGGGGLYGDEPPGSGRSGDMAGDYDDDDDEPLTPAEQEALERKQWRRAKCGRIFCAMLSIFACLFVGTLFFATYEGENFTVVDAIYFSCVTLTTVGYGDVSARTQGGRIFCTFWMIVSTLATGKALSTFFEVYSEAKRLEFERSIIRKQVTVDDLLLMDSDPENNAAGARGDRTGGDRHDDAGDDGDRSGGSSGGGRGDGGGGGGGGGEGIGGGSPTASNTDILVTHSEYIVYKLQRMGIVKSRVIAALSAQVRLPVVRSSLDADRKCFLFAAVFLFLFYGDGRG